MIGQIHLDLFLQEPYLPKYVEIRITLIRTSTDFGLVGSGAKGNIYLIEAAYNIRTLLLLAPTVANSLYQTIERNNIYNTN